MNGYNFTERVRKVLAMAREEASALDHEYVGTEHILLGLIREGEGVGAAALQSLGVDLDEIQQKLKETLMRGSPHHGTGPDLPYTSRAKKVLELAMSEARELNHRHVGTEHLLLGLIREEKGIAAQVLASVGISLDRARTETLRLLGTDVGYVQTRERAPVPGRAVVEVPFEGKDPKRFQRNVRSLPPAEWATDRARAVVARACAEAANRHSRHIEAEHLLISLLQEDGGMASTLMEQLGIDRQALQRAAAGAIEETLATDEPFDLEIGYSEGAEAALRHAFHAARAGRDRRVGTDHLLLGLLLEETAPASRVLVDAGLTADGIRATRTRIVG